MTFLSISGISFVERGMRKKNRNMKLTEDQRGNNEGDREFDAFLNQCKSTYAPWHSAVLSLGRQLHMKQIVVRVI